MTYHALAALTSPEAAELGGRAGSAGLIPLGALEQHGPHLPMLMDSLHATRWPARWPSGSPSPCW
jgi:creatinine amidohydrolase